jgi:hypothetical protein
LGQLGQAERALGDDPALRLLRGWSTPRDHSSSDQPPSDLSEYTTSRAEPRLPTVARLPARAAELSTSADAPHEVGSGHAQCLGDVEESLVKDSSAAVLDIDEDIS